MASTYKFDTSTSPISMYEWDDGVWKTEILSLNETLLLNLDGTITHTKTYSTYKKIETFSLTPDQSDAINLYYQTGETYTLLDGTALVDEPDDDEDEDDDGIEDDQDGDGSDDDLIDGTDDDDIENGGAGDDYVDGGAGDDDISGDEGDDDLFGGDGDDLISGGIGFDVLSGDAGDDDLDGNEDDDILDGGDGDDSLDGGAGDDYLDGDTGNDSLLGGDGDDELYSGDGNDTVDGGIGDDLIIGGNGAGKDMYIGGDGIDTVKYTSAVAGITANLTLGSVKSTSTDAGIGTDVLIKIENIISGNFNDVVTGGSINNRLEGGAGNDILLGMAGNDQLFGDQGDDTINGGTGLDVLTGGAGSDTYIVDHIGDAVVELAGGGTDFVQSSVSVSGLLAEDATTFYIGNYVENIQLTGTSALKATGNALDNTITGNAGANILRGGDGADTLIGGSGKDALYGGSGNDTFKFTLVSDSKTGMSARDVIADFAAGDKLDLSGIDAKAGFTSNDAFVFLGSTTPVLGNTNGVLWFKSGVLYGSTDADLVAEFEITMTGVQSMTTSDFIL